MWGEGHGWSHGYIVGDGGPYYSCVIGAWAFGGMGLQECVFELVFCRILSLL